MRVLSILDQGTKLHATSDSLVLFKGKEELKRFRPDEFQQVLLFGRVECTSSALAILAKRKMDVVFLTRLGNFRFRLASRDGSHAALKIAQLKVASSPELVFPIASAFVKGKILHQRKLLLRKQRKLKDESLAEDLCRIRILVDKLPTLTNIESIQGIEGVSAALYFSHFNKLIANPDLQFKGRSRRPPLDPVNACLSFGYTMLQYAIETEILIRGFEPSIGFLHQPLAGRSSLTLDLIEEFRPIIDSFVLRLINRSQLNALDFEYRTGQSLDEILAAEYDISDNSSESVVGCFLGPTGRKIFLSAFFARLREKMFFPPRQANLDLRAIIREQVQHLARVVENKELLYEPFIP